METFQRETVAFHDPLALMQQPHDVDSSACSLSQFEPMGDGLPLASACELDFTDLVGMMDAEESPDTEEPFSDPLSQPPTPALNGDPSFVVALFCDGFVCRHWTRKSGWVEGFAQSYDATSRYFLDCLERERLPDGLLELMDCKGQSSELLAELWDLRGHPTALCPLTSADLPRSAPTPTDAAAVDVRRVILKPRDLILLTDTTKVIQTDHPASEQFPQLSNADLEALTNDELASLALGPDADLLQVDESLALLSVDEVPCPIDESVNQLTRPCEDVFVEAPQLSMKFKAEESENEYQEDDELNWDVHQIVRPERPESWEIPQWDGSTVLAAPAVTAYPSESIIVTSHSNPSSTHSQSLQFQVPQHRTRELNLSDVGVAPAVINNALALGCSDNRSNDDFFAAGEDTEVRRYGGFSESRVVQRSITLGNLDHVYVKDEYSLSVPRRRSRTKKKSRANTPSPWPTVDNEEKTSELSLSCEDFDWAGVESEGASMKKKKKYKVLKPSIEGTKPLPATHFFLSRLKGKRPRNYTIDELDHGSPAWMMMKHMTRFYQAAFIFERRHAQFLQVNVEKIMTADHPEPESSKLRAGSMKYLAMHLQDINQPDQVVAHNAQKVIPPAFTKSTREMHVREPKISGMRSPSPPFPGGMKSPQILVGSGSPAVHRVEKSSLQSMRVVSTSSLLAYPKGRSPQVPHDIDSRSGFSFVDGLDGADYEF